MTTETKNIPSLTMGRRKTKTTIPVNPSQSHDGEHGSSSDDATMDGSGSSLSWPHPIGIAVFAMTTDRIAVW